MRSEVKIGATAWRLEYGEHGIGHDNTGHSTAATDVSLVDIIEAFNSRGSIMAVFPRAHLLSPHVYH